VTPGTCGAGGGRDLYVSVERRAESGERRFG
jgi:hypothetical protein